MESLSEKEYSYSRAGKAAIHHKYGRKLLSEEYTEEIKMATIFKAEEHLQDCMR